MEATTVQPDVNGYEELKNQLLETKNSQQQQQKQEPETPEEPKVEAAAKPEKSKYVFRKGEQVFELDEDAELEMMADKKPIKLTVKELKDRAAGDIAVKNRMHMLAEEKKKVSGTFKEFATIAKKDPIKALQYISERAREADSEFEYDQYVAKLAEQAEKMGQMSEAELKAYKLEQKLDAVEGDLSQKKVEALVVRKKQEILAEYPEIGDLQFNEYVNEVLESPILMEGVKDEAGVMMVVEKLIGEVMIQKEISGVIAEIDPSYATDNELIFALSDIIKQNPDLDEDDIKEIVSKTLGVEEKQKQAAAQRLSAKQRSSSSIETLKTRGVSEYELLKQQILEEKQSRQQR